MHKIYFFVAFLGLNIIPFLEKKPLDIDSKVQVFKDQKRTYYVIPESYIIHANGGAFIIKEIEGNKGGLTWGRHTDQIRKRVEVLRDESSMFNQILIHLENSSYPYLIENTEINDAYGSFSSTKGEVKFEVNKMKDFFFDATIIEEFVHAYQALYYNYSHAKLKMKRQRQAVLLNKKVIEKDAVNTGIINWKKFGNKHAYIESEAKLMTYIIQHETCSISVEDILATDSYNTGGKGHKILKRYFESRHFTFIRKTKRLGHLNSTFVDLNTFASYQQKFMKHWRKIDSKCNYTKGYFYHRPDALNHIYCPMQLATK